MWAACFRPVDPGPFAPRCHLLATIKICLATLTIKLPPEIQAGLLAQATAEGLDVSGDVQYVVLGQVLTKRSCDFSRQAHGFSSEQRPHNLRAWVKGHSDTTTTLLDESMERESIYGAHGRQMLELANINGSACKRPLLQLTFTDNKAALLLELTDNKLTLCDNNSLSFPSSSLKRQQQFGKTTFLPNKDLYIRSGAKH